LRFLSDRALAKMVRTWPHPIRRAAARKAAARALHTVALAGSPEDPAVLALLGLWQAAAAAKAEDDEGLAGRLVAQVALGGPIDREKAVALARPWRRRLAAAVAPADPLFASALVDDGLERAACLYAADPLAADLPAGGGAEAALLRAGMAIARGGKGEAYFDEAFTLFGLAPPAALGCAPAQLAADGGEPVTGPLVTVVMPLHDNADTIGWALTSLLRQSWRQLEVLVVDDGSGDDGPAQARAIASADRRVRVIANTHEPGAYGARNCGVAAAAGEFIGFLDADDWAHPERIARQMARLTGEAAATVSRHFRVTAEGRPIAPRVFPLIRLCPISMVVRRGVLEAAGGFLPDRTGADAELLGRLDWLCGRRAVPRDPAPLTVASWRAGSLSSDAERGMLAAGRSRYRERWMHAHAARWLAGEGQP
jgi:hypothetical protein